MKKLFFVIIVLSFSSSAWAQASGETELGTDRLGDEFFSQYIFYDWKEANLLTRYFWVNGVLNRAEFAFGPTVKIGGATVKLQFGGTTDREIMSAGLALGKVVGHQVMYIGDLKIPTRNEEQNEFFQKAFVALDEKSIWQFRIEMLNVSRDLVFLRIGVEYQHQFNDKHHLYAAPFYDPIVRKWGGQVGFRFF